MIRIALTAATLGLFGLPALAQTMPEIPDSDRNGLWSMEEMTVAYPDLTEEAFTMIDVNADGSVDADELAAALADGVLPATEG